MLARDPVHTPFTNRPDSFEPNRLAISMASFSSTCTGTSGANRISAVAMRNTERSITASRFDPTRGERRRDRGIDLLAALLDQPSGDARVIARLLGERRIGGDLLANRAQGIAHHIGTIERLHARDARATARAVGGNETLGAGASSVPVTLAAFLAPSLARRLAGAGAAGSCSCSCSCTIASASPGPRHPENASPRLAISTAASAAFHPRLPIFDPQRSAACSMVSAVTIAEDRRHPGVASHRADRPRHFRRDQIEVRRGSADDHAERDHRVVVAAHRRRARALRHLEDPAPRRDRRRPPPRPDAEGSPPRRPRCG